MNKFKNLLIAIISAGLLVAPSYAESCSKLNPESSTHDCSASKCSVQKYSMKDYSNKEEFTQVYSDIDQKYWAANAITFLTKKGIIKGYPDGTFRPDETVTRAEFVTLLVKLLNMNTATNASLPYSDMNTNHWAYRNIKISNDAGLIKGYPDGTFKPENTVKKAEVMSIVSKISNINYDLSDKEVNAVLDPYFDKKFVPKWAVLSTAKAIKEKLVTNHAFSEFVLANKNSTRSEVASMLYNVYKRYQQEKL